MNGLRTGFIVLEPSSIVPIVRSLTDKAGAGATDTEHSPVLLEDSKVGSIANLVITYTSRVSLLVYFIPIKFCCLGSKAHVSLP